MTNRQAARLRPGTRIRRKDAEDESIYIVERVVPPAGRYDAVTIYAGGHVFKPWEIERADPQPGWSPA